MTGNPVCVSVIVPVHNNSHDLLECLTALKAAAGVHSEIIVVDDASTDNTASVARQSGVRVLRREKNSGPGAARNYGVAHSRGDIVFFVDSDVVVAPDAVKRLADAFSNQPDVAAVFGSYDDRPRAKGVVSQYRNLLHHFVHQNGNPDASTFWAGCGAIRRRVFEEIGGFNAQRFPYPSIEDIELGYRLRRASYRILLDKGLQATHLKRWTFGSLLRTDIMCRAIPWSRLVLGTQKFPDDLNLKLDQRLAFALVALAMASVALVVVHPNMILIAAAALAGVVVINRKLYKFFVRQRGFLFAAGCFPLHLLYYVYSGLSYSYVAAESRLCRLAPLRLSGR